MRQPTKGGNRMPIVDLNNFAGGALSERFNLELQKVVENIADPNTEPTKVRKVTMTVTLKANENRDIAEVDITANPTLAPAKSVSSSLLIGVDGKGNVGASELKSGVKGQTFVDEEGDISEDDGSKITDFRKKRDVK